MLSTEEIKQNYTRFSDAEITKIARYESKSLRREVLDVIKDEITVRNLDLSLITWVDADNQSFTLGEKLQLFEIIENLPCPKCNDKKRKLRGAKFITVNSFIISHFYIKEKRVLCEKCIFKKAKSSFLTTFFLGWWSRSGFVFTIYVLVIKFINLFKKKHIHTKILNEIITNNVAFIRLSGITIKTISNLIDDYNKLEEESIINS